MKKILTAFLLLVTITICPIHARAEILHGDDGWSVEFTSEKEMKSNFESNRMDDVLTEMQPGDRASFQITLQNTYEMETDWYMKNEVLKSLEDASKTASGGCYSYLLTYQSENGERKILYNSERVGGEKENSELTGLHEATDALSDFFYLDTLKTGKSGIVQLTVSLDGETQGNDYQDTLARLAMEFAVELPAVWNGGDDEEHIVYQTVSKREVIREPAKLVNRIENVRTGDDTKLLPLFMTTLVSGIFLLMLCLQLLKTKKNGKRKSSGKMIGLLFVGCLFLTMKKEAYANDYFQDDFAYQIRISSGAQGLFSNGSKEIRMQVKAGTTLDFQTMLNEIQLIPTQDLLGNEIESKFYVKGLRESGKDNQTVDVQVGPVFTVTKDADYVVAYGMKGGDVSYTVRYLEKDTGKELAAPMTYQGNVGEKPVIAFLHIDGYIPTAYNLTKTLTEDEKANVFTFTYVPGQMDEYDYNHTDNGTKYVFVEGNTIYEVLPGEVIETVTEVGGVRVVNGGNRTPAANGQPGNDNPLAGENADHTEIVTGVGGAQTQREETTVIPQDLIDLDDEEVPLYDGIPGKNQSFDTVHPKTTGKMGKIASVVGAIVIGILTIICGGIFIHNKKKKRMIKTGKNVNKMTDPDNTNPQL